MSSQNGQPLVASRATLAKTALRKQGLFALAIVGAAALIFALAYFAPVSYAGSDAQPSLLVSQAILQHGTIRLDAYMDRATFDLHLWIVQNENGHYYYYWPLGPSIVSLPYVWVLNRLGLDMAIAADNDWSQNLLSAALCALVFVLLYRLGRHFLARWPSLLIAVVSVLGTGLISTMGTALWNIDFSVLFITLLLLQLAKLEGEGNGAPNPYWMGTLLFAAFFCRPSTAPFILVALVYLLLKNRHLFFRTAAISLSLLAVYIGLSWLEYGQPFQEYYNVVRLGTYSFPLGMVLYGHFLSPSRGLLVFSPFLILVLAAVAYSYPGIRRNPLCWLVAAWFVLHIAMVSRSTRWWGGHSFGPRVLTEVIPALVLLTILTWRYLGQDASLRFRQALVAGYILLGLVAIFLNSYQGLYNAHTLRWNGFLFAPDIDQHPYYLLDWQYPQFLATSKSLCARNQEHMLQGIQQSVFDLDTLDPSEEITHVSGFVDVPVVTNGTMQPENNRLALASASQPESLQHLLLLPLVLFSRENAVFVGWSKESTNYRWSVCPEAKIIFKLGELDAGDGGIALELYAGSYGVQRAMVFLNGNHIGDLLLSQVQPSPALHRLEFEGSLLNQGNLNEISFVLPDATAPGRADPRPLGLAFSSLRIESATTAEP